MNSPKLVSDPAAGLLRAISPSYVHSGDVGWEAFAVTKEEEYKLSVDQEEYSTPVDSWGRRGTLPTHSIRRLTVEQAHSAATSAGFAVAVVDDRDPSNPIEFAHASIEMAAGSRKQRLALAGLLALLSTHLYP